MLKPGFTYLHCGYSYEGDNTSFRTFYTSVTLHGVTHQKTSSLTCGIRFGTAFWVHMLNDDFEYDDNNNKL